MEDRLGNTRRVKKRVDQADLDADSYHADLALIGRCADCARLENMLLADAGGDWEAANAKFCEAWISECWDRARKTILKYESPESLRKLVLHHVSDKESKLFKTEDENELRGEAFKIVQEAFVDYLSGRSETEIVKYLCAAREELGEYRHFLGSFFGEIAWGVYGEACAVLGDLPSPPREDGGAQSQTGTQSTSETLHPYSLLYKGEQWTFSFDGEVKACKHGKGLIHISVLLQRPGEELGAGVLSRIADRLTGTADPARIHVLEDIAVADHGLGEVHFSEDELLRDDEGIVRSALGGLLSERNDAERKGNVVAAEVVTGKIREVRKHTGMNAPNRQLLGDPDQAARKKVSQAIERATEAIAKKHQGLGAHLKAYITRGVKCSYKPPEPPPHWHVELPRPGS